MNKWSGIEKNFPLPVSDFIDLVGGEKQEILAIVEDALSRKVDEEYILKDSHKDAIRLALKEFTEKKELEQRAALLKKIEEKAQEDIKLPKRLRVKKRLSRPRNYNDPTKILEFIINKLVVKDRHDSTLNHKQMANVVFGIGDEINMGYLSKPLKRYQDYVIRKGSKYKWDIAKIYRDFPEWFANPAPVSKRPAIFEMIDALNEEKRVAARNNYQQSFKIKNVRKIDHPFSSRIYSGHLIVEADEEPNLQEETPANLVVEGVYYHIRVIEYDHKTEQLYFQINNAHVALEGHRQGRITLDTRWLLESVQYRLLDAREVESALFKKILQNGQDLTTYAMPKDISLGQMDASQKKATQQAISKDISLIWGPPGTGKSYTLSYVLNHLFREKERTLVCSIANIAVDSLLRKFLDVARVENPLLLKEENRVMRLGVSRDPQLLQYPELFPDRGELVQLRSELQDIERELNKEHLPTERKVVLKVKRRSLREKISEVSRAFMNTGYAFFSTAAKALADQDVYQTSFDNLVIDEASMMSIPHFVALASLARKRVIIAGDFRQLGPIVQSSGRLADTYLHRDVFQFFGVQPDKDDLGHPGLMPLTVQRRMHPDIAEVINAPFYKGLLKSHIPPYHLNMKDELPFVGNSIVYLPVQKDDPDYLVERTAQGSRHNAKTRQLVVERVLDKLSQNPGFHLSVGIIAPYRSQVFRYRKLIEKSGWPNRFTRNIRCGTIHTFQGSEEDVIIWDIVDAPNEPIGNLYLMQIGERLLNVAISRAKFKLIVVGDLSIFFHGKGFNNVSTRFRQVINILKKKVVEVP